MAPPGLAQHPASWGSLPETCAVNLLRLHRRDQPARPSAEQRLRRTVEQMPTAVVMFDAADFTILFANAATAGMLATLAPTLAGPGGLVGTRIGALHPELARAAVQLSPATTFPVTGRLRYGAETVDYLLSPVAGPEAGRPEAYLLTWWVSTAQGQVAERFEGEVKALFDRLVATAGELGSSSDEVASLVDTTRQETQAASTAADQLATAIRDICAQLSRASLVSEKAVGEARTSDSRIGSLAQSAAAIGNIVAIINEIADRTNLLALNATIEAARAGAAGKGFAVVAQEVKTLAGQTAKATADISSQVAAIQGASGEVVSTIAGIGQIIEEIRGILATISAAVEQQSAATRDASGRLAHLSDLAARSDKAASTMAAAASRVDDAGGTLRTALDRFLEQVRHL